MFIYRLQNMRGITEHEGQSMEENGSNREEQYLPVLEED
jgi:hypothetical protein